MASEGLSERGRAWQERIEHQQSIGLSITEYCEVVGVSTASFYQWRKRLAVGEPSICQGVGSPNAEGAGDDEQPVFVPVEVRLRDDLAAIRIVLPNQAVVELPGDLDSQRLIEAIRAAGSAAIPSPGAATC
jgi:hypothetical protein